LISCFNLFDIDHFELKKILFLACPIPSYAYDNGPGPSKRTRFEPAPGEQQNRPLMPPPLIVPNVPPPQIGRGEGQQKPIDLVRNFCKKFF